MLHPQHQSTQTPSAQVTSARKALAEDLKTRRSTSPQSPSEVACMEAKPAVPQASPARVGWLPTVLPASLVSRLEAACPALELAASLVLGTRRPQAQATLQPVQAKSRVRCGARAIKPSAWAVLVAPLFNTCRQILNQTSPPPLSS